MFRSLALLACIPVTAIAFPQIPAKPEDKKEMAPKEETKPDDIDVHKTAERIAENAQKAGDRLKDKDPGADTRKIQKDILNDIDALIKKALQPPPPPMSSDMNPMMPPPPMGGGGMGGGMSGGMPPKPTGGMGNSGQQSPMPMGGTSGNSKSKPGGGSGSNGRRRRERKPRGGSPMSTREPMAKAGPDGKEPRPAKLEPKEVGSGGGDKTDFGGGFGKSNSKREAR